MKDSAAIGDSPLRHARTRRARRSVGQHTVSSMPPSLATPRACLAWRLRDFATNRHEYCGLVLVHDGFEVTAADHLFIEQLLRSFEKRGLFVPPAAVHALELLIDDTAHFTVDLTGGLL